ncbi:hypothetical protein [Deinococcus humi]|uniref:Uncharacterized protein n=1 Tax=Deinococcus humi TaxID=662880 RepID=A0A7W8JSM9_9DEIO|nr:hypothetical protein [Deinococcus humi]MBB5362497.1 hypothetical protein [Deinococcus humi]
MLNDAVPVMTLESLRVHLYAVRDQSRLKMVEEQVLAPSWSAGLLVERLLAEQLISEGVIQVDVWREAMFSPDGDDVRTLHIRLTWSTGEILEVYLFDHPSMEILLVPPEEARAPGGLDLSIDLDDPENKAWAELRLWGEEFLPDPFLEDQNETFADTY